MKKITVLVSMALLAVMTIAVFAALMAVEVIFLLFLGLEYASIGTLITFFILYGIVEYIGSSVIKGIIKHKKPMQEALHYFWGQAILALVLMFAFVKWMDGIYLATESIIIYSLATAFLFILFEGKLKRPTK